jgi:hypothetical protein
MTATLYSAPVKCSNLEGICFQPVFTGTPTGAFKLQISNDGSNGALPETPFTPTNWTDLASPTASASGAAGNAALTATGVYSVWIRLVYTFTSGTGSLTVRACGKGAS